MPEANLNWILPNQLKSLSKLDYVILQGQFLRNSISNLTLILNRTYNGQLILCQAYSLALNLLNQTMIVQKEIQVFCKIFLFFKFNENKRKNKNFRSSRNKNEIVWRND